MPRGYVEDEGRPLGDACRGSRQTAPSGWSTMALVVNVGEKASARCQVGIQKVSDPRKRRKTPLADVEIEGMASLSRQAEAAPAYGLRGIRRTGGTSWIRAFTWNVGTWPVMRSENPISVAHEGGK